MDYAAAAPLVDPTATFSSFCQITHSYESLVWVSTPIPKATLEATWLGYQKQLKIGVLGEALRTQMASGFLSDALVPGAMRRYDSDIQGQIVVIGALAFMQDHAGITPSPSFTFGSADLVTGMREYHAHNYIQAWTLLTALGTYANSLTAVLMGKIGQVMMINTGNIDADLASVAAITW